ncbi:MAG TPA: nucleotidyltransferase domain-containing protein [Solirubrobacterales bacterium]|nr:nucleotidyltransferase domain-containing protein [Solirubrobacterales bacterium]
MGIVGELAKELGAPERTLRRAVDVGAIHSRRPSERRLRLADGERAYLRRNWPLLAELREALRTEPRVRLAILAGSLARGDDHALSDVDLVVDLRDENPLARLRLAVRLEEKLGREVDVASWKQVADDPLSLLQVLDEGRAIVDRDGAWRELFERKSVIRRRAARSYNRQREQASALKSRPLH